MAEELAAGRGFVSAIFGRGPLAVAAGGDPSQLTSLLYPPCPHSIPLPGNSLTLASPAFLREAKLCPVMVPHIPSKTVDQTPPPLVGKERAGALVVWAYCLVIPLGWLGE